MTMWGGRTSKPTAEVVRQLNTSLPFDVRLYAEDIDASIAWSRALVGAGILSAAEQEQLEGGLEAVRQEFEGGDFQAEPSDEDIHSAVERRLTERLGAVAGKLHSGRSRNDQVATDFRLWVMRACDRLDGMLHDLASALAQSAENYLNAPMPGYTHLRPAQPVTWGHWALSHAWPLVRDHDRLQAASASAATLPLGSGALAGSSLSVDRTALAASLGFSVVAGNSLDAVADRDFAAEFLFSAALLGVHLSRLAEGLILFSSPEFGFVRLDDAFVTGSSLMPNKANPDPLELARGKCGRLIGHLTGLLTTLKGLPSAYDKDLQEDKEPVFDAYDTLSVVLPALSGLTASLQIDEARMRAAIPPAIFATDLADYLVEKGIPFRQAHRSVSQAVRAAEERGVDLSELPLVAYREIESAFEQDLFEVFDLEKSLARRAVIGGTAPGSLKDQLQALARALGEKA